MTVQLPSLLVVNFGEGRFLLTKAKVATSLAPPHSILMRCSVSTVKRALPACTTAAGLGLGSFPVAADTTMKMRKYTALVKRFMVFESDSTAL